MSNAATVTQAMDRRIHPHQFALYASMASILMMFIAFTSAYLVRQAAGNWQEYLIPDVFYISTGILLLSSVTIHMAYRGYVAGKESRYKGLLLATAALGMAFVVLQYFGWQNLYASGVALDGNPSGSFFYVISGIHAMHVLGGIAAITVALIHAFAQKFEFKKNRKIRFSLVVQYWHFVDLLWVYLLIFLLVAR